jgi:hypothetical protein
MEKKMFQIISGEVFEVQASSGKEALAKYYAFADCESCPCGTENCDCVQFGEATSILLDKDSEA